MDKNLYNLSCDLFDGISADDIENITSCVGSETLHFDKNSLIWITDENIKSIGVIILGCVQVIKEDIFGNRNIISVLSQGEIFGEVFVCAGIKKSPVTVLATSDCEVMFIDAKRILATCNNTCLFHSKLIENLLKIIANRNLILSLKLELLSKRTTREKIMTFLLSQYEINKTNPFNISLNRQQLADYLCTDRSALSRELCKMRDEGIIEFWKNSFKLINITYSF